MSDFKITCCSTADLSKEYFERREVPIAYFHYSVGEDEYLDDMGKSLSHKKLYERMLAGEVTKTSQVSVMEYEELFESVLKDGKDVLHITISSGISGSVNSANIAAENMREKYPDRKIYVVDSLGASSGYGLIVDKALDMKDAGDDIDTIYNWLMEHRLNMHHWFFSTDLTFYIRGGRVSKTAGFFGQMLGICPLLNMDNLGRLIPREKHRGKGKVKRKTLEKMIEHADGGTQYSGKVFMCQSDCEDDAKDLAKMIEDTFPNIDGKVEIFPIGATIGSHTGPGTISIFFWGDKRVD